MHAAAGGNRTGVDGSLATLTRQMQEVSEVRCLQVRTGRTVHQVVHQQGQWSVLLGRISVLESAAAPGVVYMG